MKIIVNLRYTPNKCDNIKKETVIVANKLNNSYFYINYVFKIL